MARQDRQTEEIVKGFANERRIEMLRRLADEPEMTLTQIADACRLEVPTAQGHVRRLHEAGLIDKHPSGREVYHELTALGEQALEFVQSIAGQRARGRRKKKSRRRR